MSNKKYISKKEYLKLSIAEKQCYRKQYRIFNGTEWIDCGFLPFCETDYHQRLEVYIEKPKPRDIYENEYAVKKSEEYIKSLGSIEELLELPTLKNAFLEGYNEALKLKNNENN